MLRSYHPLQESHVGWYLVTYAVVCSPARFALRDPHSENWRVVWENRVLIAASSPLSALEKAAEHGKLHDDEYMNPNGERLRSQFYGFISMGPVHDDIGSGCEVEWTDRTGISMDQLDSYIAGRNPSEAFNYFRGISENDVREFPPSIPHVSSAETSHAG